MRRILDGLCPQSTEETVVSGKRRKCVNKISIRKVGMYQEKGNLPFTYS